MSSCTPTSFSRGDKGLHLKLRGMATPLAVLPSRKSDQEISKSDFYQTIFLPNVRPKTDPHSIF